MAEELLEHHTNVDVVNAEGSTALHWAARRDQHAIIKLLLRAGASVHIENKWGLTPLQVAQQNGNEHSVVALSLWMKTLEATNPGPKPPPTPPKVAPQVRALSQEERAKREARKEEGKARAEAAKNKLKEEQAAKAQHTAMLREQVKCEKKVRHQPPLR